MVQIYMKIQPIKPTMAVFDGGSKIQVRVVSPSDCKRVPLLALDSLQQDFRWDEISQR